MAKKAAPRNVAVDDLSDEDLEKALQSEGPVTPQEPQTPAVEPGEPQEPEPKPQAPVKPQEPEEEEDPEAEPAVPGQEPEPKSQTPKEPDSLSVVLKKPKVIDKKAPEVKGLTQDLVSERERRRQAEARADALEARLAKLEAQAGVQPVKPQPAAAEPDSIEIDDDDVVSGKVFKQVSSKIDNLNKKIDDQAAALAEKERNAAYERNKNLDAAAREKYSAEKVGEHYSFDSVIANVIIPMMDANPAVAAHISAAQNPSETAYRLGIAHLIDLGALSGSQTPAQPAQGPQIPAAPAAPHTPKSAPRTLGQVPAGGGASGDVDLASLTDNQISTMSDKDLEALLKKLS